MEQSPMVIVATPECAVCKEKSFIPVERERYERWMGGAYIQHAFANLTADEREVLITGTHPACWKRLFPEEE